MNSFILPPRLEDRVDDHVDEIPVFVEAERTRYEEISASLRPTWLPVDPTIAPPPRAYTHLAANIAKVAGLLAMTWVTGFGGVVGMHAARDYAAKRARAAAGAPPIATVAAALIADVPVATAPQPAAPSSSIATAAKNTGSGVIFTVNVNDLPVSKDAPRSRGKSSRGSSPAHASRS